MKYFLDTEFFDDAENNKIVPISLGLVCEDGRELYCVFYDFSFYRIELPEWHKENIIPSLLLTPGEAFIMAKASKKYIVEFIGDNKPEFYGWYSSYDWVVFSQIFNGMLNTPKGWPKYINDLHVMYPSIRFPKKEIDRHNALEDARWIKDSYKFLGID